MRKLKVWNGRGYCCKKWVDKRWAGAETRHAYVCAYSRADARRVIAEYCGQIPPDSELKEFWSECWGNSMEGIKRERGLWIEFKNNIPTKVI